jgi:hypothetical protein
MANVQNVVAILAFFTLDKEQRSRVREKDAEKINSFLPKREEISGTWRKLHVIVHSFS